ncbi:MAG: HK97 family phage prohead protease [Halanaerobiales bacterium]
MAKKNKLPEKEEKVIRSFGIPDIRAEVVEEEGNIIEGHPAVYEERVSIGPPDDPWFYEIIERGAFDDTDFDDVLFTANHEMWDIPLARSRRNNTSAKKSTMELKLDDIGVFIRANLDIERNSEAKKLYSAVDRGDIDGMSFIFYVADERWTDMDKDVPTRYIKKIAKVREVSAVNFPAYEGTDIQARSDQTALENAKKALENARSTLDNEKNERNKETVLEMERLKAQILMRG